MTIEDELRQMGVQEPNVPILAKVVRDSAISCLCSTDAILSSIKIMMQRGDEVIHRQFSLANYSAGLLKK